MKRILNCALSLACVCAFTVSAKDSTAPSRYQTALEGVPAAELPAKAADMVKQVKARDWANTTVSVTKSAVTINPAAAPSIVGAIARSVPDMAAVAAGTAAAEQPKQAAAIAKAAAAAAPAKAGKIAAAVCRAVPNDYKAIAAAVAQAVPGSSKEVVQAVASAIPELKQGLEKALASNAGGSMNVAAVLDQAGATKDGSGISSGPPPRGPTVGPPFIPLTGTPNTVTPATSGEVPTGGRDYARP